MLTSTSMGFFSKTETFEFKVSGMDCGGCENSVSSALTKIYGVKSVKASAINGTVVVLAKGVDSDKIKAGILSAGFGVE